MDLSNFFYQEFVETFEVFFKRTAIPCTCLTPYSNTASWRKLAALKSFQTWFLRDLCVFYSNENQRLGLIQVVKLALAVVDRLIISKQVS